MKNEKMKNEKMITSFGTVDIPSITFDRDSIPVMFDITEIPVDVMWKIKEAVEREKLIHFMNHLEADNLEWGQLGVEVYFTYLCAVINATKDSQYYIIAGFKDLENDSLESEICIEVDLLEYDNALREIIMDAMIGKFIKRS